MADQVNIDAKQLREFMSKMDYFAHNSKPDLERSEYSSLVTNGGFDADSDWTKGTGWTIGSGKATHTATGGGDIYLAFKCVIGRNYSYRTVLDATGDTSLGNTDVQIRDLTKTLIVSSQPAAELSPDAVNYTAKVFIVPRVDLLARCYSTDDVTWDNVSIWECDPSDGVPWLRLTQGHVFDERSSIWRDDAPLYEGEYEVINRFGQTFIKPLTAPGVNTRFQLFTAPEKRP